MTDIYQQREYVGQRQDAVEGQKLGIKEIDHRIEHRQQQIERLLIERKRAERQLAEYERLYKLGVQNLERMEHEAR